MLKAIAALLLILFVPGTLLWRLLYGERRIKMGRAEAAGIIFCLGAGYWFLCSVPYYYFGASLSLTAHAGVLIAAGGLALDLTIRRKTSFRRIFNPGKPEPELVLLVLATLCSVGLVSVSAYYHGYYFDTFFHLAAVKKLLMWPVYHWVDPISGALNAGQSHYRKNTWYLIQAVGVILSGTSAAQVYVASCSIVALMSPVCIVALSRRLTTESAVPFLAATLYIAYWTLRYTQNVAPIFPVLYDVFAAYPGEMLRFTFFPVLMVLAIRCVTASETGDLIAFVFLTMVQMTIHVQFLIYSALGVFSMIPWVALRGRHGMRRRLAILCGAMLLAGCVMHLWRFAGEPRAAVHWFHLPYETNPYVVTHDYLVLKPDSYLLHPWWSLIKNPSWHPMLAVIALLIVYLPWATRLRQRFDPTTLALMASMAMMPFLIIFNPFVVPLLVHELTWIIPRRIGIFSHHAVFAAIGYSVLAAILLDISRALTARLGPRSWIASPSALTTIGIAGLLLCSRPLPSLRAALVPRPGFLDITREVQKGLFQYFERLAPAQVICSDPDTSYLLAAYTPMFALSVDATRMGVMDDEIAAREQAQRTIMAFKAPKEEMRLVFERFSVKYVVTKRGGINDQILRRYNGLLVPEYADNDYSVYRVSL